MSRRRRTFQVTGQQPRRITLDGPGEYLIELSEPGSQVEVRGAFTAADSDQLEVVVTVHHQAAHTRANTTLHGIGQDRGRLVLKGRIVIDADCGDSNSFLTERVLLLSDTASAETVPDLEILSEDVKCSHAASISNIPEDQLFYLMSRGIPRDSAAAAIAAGFLNAARFEEDRTEGPVT
ncbi:MAG: hypothetical protein COU69_03890 [Candidatus Pacebacteria bacterium CG10_big_fil_rev_8_21_14_0_10_56_10]|nr:MAG: hypothetical protein COU69_03890 [Candidatus Pacebacteria bacterium CG10_big_fil_rev_8_21_14_0_10_56_10]